MALMVRSSYLMVWAGFKKIDSINLATQHPQGRRNDGPSNSAGRGRPDPEKPLQIRHPSEGQRTAVGMVLPVYPAPLAVPEALF